MQLLVMILHIMKYFIIDTDDFIQSYIAIAASENSWIISYIWLCGSFI